MSEPPAVERGEREGAIGYTIGGLVMAPPIGGALAAAALVLASAILSPSSGSLTYLHFSITVGFFVGVVVGIPAALLVGLPAYLAMKRNGIVRRRYYAALGGVIAVLLCVVLSGQAILSSPTLGATLITAFAFGGIIGGIVFWSIRRPDRDPRSAQPLEGSET